MATRPSQTRQDKQDNELILYRLDRVESAVRDVGTKVDKQDNIKRQDLLDFRETLVSRFNEVRDDLQKQIDGKAERDQVDDLRTLIKAVGAIFGSIIAGLVIYYLTTGRR